MGSITLLFYTASRIPEKFAMNVRNHLLMTAQGKPIISISQKPIDFGENICVGDIGYTVPNVYAQILTGAKAAKTQYVACCEDDTLYVPEHFDYTLPYEAFCYNKHRWNLTNGHFYLRHRSVNMCSCIAPTLLMINTLEERFEKMRMGWTLLHFGEPGRRERMNGLTEVRSALFNTDNPIIQINHSSSLGGLRAKLKTDIVQVELPMWGKATDLWEKMWNA